MKGCIIYTAREAKRNEFAIGLFVKYLNKYGMDAELLVRENMSLGIADTHFPYDFALVRTREPVLSSQLENIGVQVFNSGRVSHICNSKARTYSCVHSLGIPIMPTWIGGCADPPFPVVLKPNNGHGGINVVKAENMTEYRQCLRLFNDNDFVVQKLADNIGRDVRVYVVGDEIIAAMLRVSENDFRSNFCLGGSAQRYTLNEYETRLVKKIMRRFNFGYAGIDFVFNEGRAVFNEIEDVVGARMLYTHTDIDIIDIYCKYIARRMNTLKSDAG